MLKILKSEVRRNLSGNHLEVAIVGENAINLLNELQKIYLPGVVFCAGTSENDLPLLQSRYVSGKTLIYICRENSCQLPLETVDEALAIISKKSS